MQKWSLKLFNYKQIYDHTGSEDVFVKAMIESFQFHYENSKDYKAILDIRNVDVYALKTMEDIIKVPPIPANFLKFHEIISIDKNNVEIHATSSGTQGQKSQIFLDSDTIKLATKMVIKMMKYHKMLSAIPTNYFSLGYEPIKGSTSGNVQLNSAMMRFAPPRNKLYALRYLGDHYEIDYFGVLEGLLKYDKQKSPVRIMGFPAYLYMVIKTMKDHGMKPLNFGKKSFVLTGGGWKNYDDMAIDKDEYYDLIEEYLGIPKENCRDFYSAVEHSVAYPECKNHHMHIPIWSRVIIRDVRTLEPVGYDTPGFISFISPLVQSQPISSILMGDLAILRKGEKCGCGITTDYFEVLGRAGTAKGASCAMTASEYLKGGQNG